MGNGQTISIEIHADFSSIRADWQALQASGITTLFQTFEWCSTWYDVVGCSLGVTPQIVVGRDQAGRAVFLLPFSICQHGSYRVLEWLSSGFITYGFGVYNRRFIAENTNVMTQSWPDILNALPRLDAIWLKYLPEHWRGTPHPLAALFSTQSANQSYQLKLQPNYDELYEAKRPTASRRRARQKDKKLHAAGEVICGPPKSPADGERLIDQMIAQQVKQLAARGVHNVLQNGMAAFLKRLSALDAASPVQMFPQYVQVDGELAAAKMGLTFDGTYWATISSTGGGQVQRFSPGDYALRSTIEACCEKGLDILDFSTGDSDYKQRWTDSSIVLSEIITARSARGMLWVAAKRASIDTKRAIKQSQFWWPRLSRLRRAAFGSNIKN